MADLPEWSAFDPSAAPLLPEHADRPGRLVAVVATRSAREDGWAINATVDIGRAWSESGRRVVLADAALGLATLHECLETDNTEGVTDTVLFGSSVRRVAKRIDESEFFIITAGTASADPAAIFASDRWTRLSRGFVEAGVTLVMYVGAESDGMSAILDMATDVVLLAGSTEDAQSAVHGTAAPVRAVTGPASGTPSDMTPSDELAEALDPLAGQVDAGAGDSEQSTEQEGMPAHPADSELPAAEASIVEAAEGGDAPAASRSKRSLLLVFIIISLGIVGAAVLGWVDIPGISPEGVR